MVYTVYILFSEKHHKIYIGFTSNLLERFKSHNLLSKKGFTLRYRPWTVIYCEHFSHRADASNREKHLKSAKAREWIWQKITTEVPTNGFISA